MIGGFISDSCVNVKLTSSLLDLKKLIKSDFVDALRMFHTCFTDWILFYTSNELSINGLLLPTLQLVVLG